MNTLSLFQYEVNGVSLKHLLNKIWMTLHLREQLTWTLLTSQLCQQKLQEITSQILELDTKEMTCICLQFLLE